ncbi:hypothetical protein GCM10008986_24850 [Salinibacillus aidingensis]|uniref:DUF6431 domain-containing protein n=1 Tax=Salinibacillus aidingensis TaxID=237684 RepID=A0ABN1BGG4_9BACI
MAQLYHNFEVDFKTYARLGQNNCFPDYDSCPECHSKDRLSRHGFYWRYGVTGIITQRVPICRYRCRNCKKTFSVLPSFFIPYFQHTLETVMDMIHEKLVNNKKKSYRQLVDFYVKRFFSQLSWVHMCLADWGNIIDFQEVHQQKTKAIKYMTMIRDFGESTFLRRSKGHLSSYFMAPPPS